MKKVEKETELQTEYELLRDNVRGITNHSRGLCIFLQQGMIGWIKFLNYRLQETPAPLFSHNNKDTSMLHAQELTSGMNGILADMLFSFNSQQK
jgi:hypothetical protein